MIKKDFIFAPIMLAIAVLLFLLRATGMVAHIAISIIGVLVLLVYTVLTKKDWKIPALEIIMRAFYGIALITGVVIMNVHCITLVVVHKFSAVLFMALIIVLLTHKVATNKKPNIQC